MWQSLSRSLGLEDDLIPRPADLGLRTVLVDFAERRRRLERARCLGRRDRYLVRVALMADLMRLRGVGVQYAELLVAAGLGLGSLRERSTGGLLEQLAQVNLERRIARRNPSLRQIESWIEQSKSLEPLVHCPAAP